MFYGINNLTPQLSSMANAFATTCYAKCLFISMTMKIPILKNNSTTAVSLEILVIVIVVMEDSVFQVKSIILAMLLQTVVAILVVLL